MHITKIEGERRLVAVIGDDGQSLSLPAHGQKESRHFSALGALDTRYASLEELMSDTDAVGCTPVYEGDKVEIQF